MNLEKSRLSEDLINVYNYLMVGKKNEEGVRPWGEASDRTRGTDLKQIKTQKFLSELMKTLLYYEASQTLESFTERACDSSTLGDTQAP